MRRNYLQFLVLVLVAVGMIMIAGIRQEVDDLKDQVASSLTSRTASTSLNLGQEYMNPRMFTVMDAEAMAAKMGWIKQSDGSFAAKDKSAQKHYVCQTCMANGGSCCVDKGLGYKMGNGGYCNGMTGQSAYDGICSTGQASVGSGTTVSSERKKCMYTDQCGFYENCVGANHGGGIWGECIPYSGRVSGTGTEPSIALAPLNRTLRFGMSGGDDINTLQYILGRQGLLASEPSGYFGQMTLDAVKAFQTQNGITPVTGIVGENTRTKINSLIAQYMVR